jgi:hypothetical protein
MPIEFDKKTIKKMGRKSALQRVQDIGLEGKLAREIEKRIVKITKKPRKPPEKLKTKLLKARVTETEMLKAQVYADKKGITVSQLIRDYLRRLPAIDE